ncbi:Chloramphenicol 3-O phosphotransferase [Candidatus Izimaplasma bacterium HR1]|jgi:chloramphenicol 3-O-phosphotransferase|nr:Chloramphenicol 3-O phosphotransferase [Candidatus Izimaplasma bacterium HR1]
MNEVKGKIIILNGVSSSGKTTISKELQKEMEEHYFWVANDTFCDMSSSKHWKQDWIAIINEALNGMIYTIKSFSDLGYNVIVDQVFLNNESQGTVLQKFVEVLHNYPVLFVRVDSSLEDLRKREIERGNRRIGQAESQLNIVHSHQIYDIAINTSEKCLEDNVQIIKSELKNNTKHNAFFDLYKKYQEIDSVY